MKNSHAFFRNISCRYFPCHQGVREEDFNCLFCYCPLYPLGPRCGGNFSYLENGIKDCSFCTIPHAPGGYDYVLSRFDQVAELAKEDRDPDK